jgi:hypothetical protein
LGCLGSSGSKKKKVNLSYSEQLLRVVFSTFCGQIKKKNFLNILATALKSYITFKVFLADLDQMVFCYQSFSDLL